MLYVPVLYEYRYIQVCTIRPYRYFSATNRTGSPLVPKSLLSYGIPVPVRYSYMPVTGEGSPHTVRVLVQYKYEVVLLYQLISSNCVLVLQFNASSSSSALLITEYLPVAVWSIRRESIAVRIIRTNQAKTQGLIQVSICQWPHSPHRHTFLTVSQLAQ